MNETQVGSPNLYLPTHLHLVYEIRRDSRSLLQEALAAKSASLRREIHPVKKSKRRGWTSDDIRTLKSLAKKKTKAGTIARALKRTEGATRQKAFSLGLSLDARGA
jgi:hypothetical protein